jgi:hypothetical protein
MAESVADGHIEITKSEVKVPLLISQFNFIQIPLVNGQALFRVFISNHGDITKTWMSLTQDAIMYVKPPFYLYATTPCKIPAMIT